MTALRTGPSLPHSSKQPNSTVSIPSPARRCPQPPGQSLAENSPRRASSLGLVRSAPHVTPCRINQANKQRVPMHRLHRSSPHRSAILLSAASQSAICWRSFARFECRCFPPGYEKSGAEFLAASFTNACQNYQADRLPARVQARYMRRLVCRCRPFGTTEVARISSG